jgi:transposase
MSKKIKLIIHDTVEEWRDKIRKIRSNEYKLKMLVIEKILADPNISGKYLQEMFLISPATMFNWIDWYNEGGLDKLKSGNGGRGSKGKGNKKFEDNVFEQLTQEIDKNQNKVWTLGKMQNFIKEKFKIEPTLQAIHYRLKGKYSYKSSRPYPYKADRNKLGQFKKTL